MDSAKVTVVIPTYNKEKYIAQAIRSIECQTFQDIKILIVDDASTDNTVEIVKKMAPSNVKLIELEENKGICHVLNKALEHIDTKYFVQLDGDDWLVPEAVQLLFERLEKEKETTALAYANSAYWVHQNGVDNFRSIRKHRSLADRYDFVTFFGMVQPRFYRTECVKKVGGWETDDPTNGRMMEDRRMLLRLLDEYHFTYVNRILYHFRSDGKNLSSDKNAPIYNSLLKLYTDRALIRWGGHYQADYVEYIDGWDGVKLIPNENN